MADRILAESEGFEPPEQLPVHRISSAAHSTTLATFLKSGAKVVNYRYQHHFALKKSCGRKHTTTHPKNLQSKAEPANG